MPFLLSFFSSVENHLLTSHICFPIGHRKLVSSQILYRSRLRAPTAQFNSTALPPPPKSEGRDLAKHFGCQFLETSAKQRIHVDDAFIQLVREIRKYNKVRPAYPWPFFSLPPRFRVSSRHPDPHASLTPLSSSSVLPTCLTPLFTSLISVRVTYLSSYPLSYRNKLPADPADRPALVLRAHSNSRLRKRTTLADAAALSPKTLRRLYIRPDL